ncbi:MAG: ketopantoate reductase family protein [Deltaproteobacteria bacterium]|nr:ketopantoate reductase family protein [Deltaproteobacteria bacterium]
MPPIAKVSVIGAGAMGAFYATNLFDMDKNCISLVAKGERYDRLKQKGLIVNNKHYSLPIIKPEDKTPPSEFIIVAVKHHHLREAIQDIENRIGENSLIVSVMNGIDSEEQIGAVYGMDKVLYAVAVGIDAVRQGNSITYTKQGKLFFGEAKNPVLTERVKRAQSLFDRAGIAYETPDDMIRILWWKFMINVGINQVSAVLHAPYSIFQTSQEARELMESAMREVMSIAKAAKVHLSEEDIENWYSVLSGLSPQGKTSMLQDIEAKRKTEVEMFAGKMIELGRTYGIPTPVNQTLFRLIKVIEQSLD